MDLKRIIREELQNVQDSRNVASLKDTLIAFNKYGELETPVELTDQKLNWLFNQVLAIITELRQYRIETSDYLNTDNWGLKPDGQLGMFDIGFGDYFDDFENAPDSLDLNEQSEMLNKILKQLNIPSAEYLGSGYFGAAHDIGNNKVLKLTRDKSEAINSQKLIGKKLKHIADIYEVKQFVSTLNNKTHYAIILEKLRIDNSLAEDFKRLQAHFDELRNKHYSIDLLDKIGAKHPKVESFLRDMVKIGYDHTWQKWMRKPEFDTDEYDYNDISEIAEWIKGSVTNEHDLEDEPPYYVAQLVTDLLK